MQNAAYLTATRRAGNTCQPQSQLFIFESISDTPTFSFFMSRKTKAFFFSIYAKTKTIFRSPFLCFYLIGN